MSLDLIRAKLMQELSLLPSDLDDMTLAELTLYGVITDQKDRRRLYSVSDAFALQRVIEALTPEERLEFLTRKYALWH